MEKADVVVNCNRLSHELENAQSAVKSDQEEIRLVEQEVTRLENAKIALRIEFGNLRDKARILERENALQQIQLSINSRKNELANLRFSKEKMRRN